MTSTRHLEIQAETQRAGLARSLEGLRDAATPSHVTTEIITLAKDSGLSIAKALAESARANPIPALMIGAGLMMLLTRNGDSGGNGTANARSNGSSSDVFSQAGSMLKSAALAGMGMVRSTTETVADGATATAQRAGDAAASVKATASDTLDLAGKRAQDLGQQAKETLDKATGTASSTYAAVRDRATDVKDQVVAKAGDLAEQGRAAALDAQGQANKLATEATTFISKVAAEQPIVVAAIGAAIGAAMAAILPITQSEKQYLGAASARVKQAGIDKLTKVAEVVKAETVGEDGTKKISAIADRALATAIDHPVAQNA